MLLFCSVAIMEKLEPTSATFERTGKYNRTSHEAPSAPCSVSKQHRARRSDPRPCVEYQIALLALCTAIQFLHAARTAAGASHWVLNEERGLIEVAAHSPPVAREDGCQNTIHCKEAKAASSTDAGFQGKHDSETPASRVGDGDSILEMTRDKMSSSEAGGLSAADPVVSLAMQGKGNQPPRIKNLHPEPALAVLFERYGGVDKALELLEESTKTKPTDPVLWSDLGNAYRVKGESEKAIQCFETALRIQPHPDFFLNLGGVHFALGELDEAVQLFTIGLQMNPRHALLQFSMGSVFAVQGRKEDAVNSFETTLRIQPDFKPAEQYLRQLHEELGSRRWILSRERCLALGLFAVAVVLVQRAVHCVMMRPQPARDAGTSEDSSESAGRDTPRPRRTHKSGGTHKS